MARYYTLDGKTPVPADLFTWGTWMESGTNRHVADEAVNGHRVSTVFLGLDHQFGDGPPLLFETMVFPEGTMSDEWCERCSTWEEAEAMHQRGVAFAKENASPVQSMSDTVAMLDNSIAKFRRRQFDV